VLREFCCENLVWTHLQLLQLVFSCTDPGLRSAPPWAEPLLRLRRVKIPLHFALIGYGVFVHAGHLPMLIPDTLGQTAGLAHNMGWIFVASLVLRAYSLGGGKQRRLHLKGKQMVLLPMRVG
jgi:hypothetical protein